MTWTCKHCNKTYSFEGRADKANHSRWCDENPKRTSYVDKLSETNKAGKGNGYTKAKALGLPQPKHSDETLKILSEKSRKLKHSEETKLIISQKALASNHRRLRKNPIEYNGVLMDSTWEVAFAKRLDTLGVEWVRPDPVKWIDKEGREHNYFPDFLLIKENLFVDTKNKHAYDVQREKIEILLNTFPNLIFLTSLSEIMEYEPGMKL